jgi:hypothetical protein
MRRIRLIARMMVLTTVAGMFVGVATPAMAWLSPGPTTVHPSIGGTWQYGFWNARVRSYYTLNRNHGSSVELNGTLHRSICTAPNQQSIAHAWAIQSPGATDRYYYRTC